MIGRLAPAARRLASARGPVRHSSIQRETKNTLLAPFTKLMRAVDQRGWNGVMMQLYTIGDLKFGELKGTDKFGNKYYEDLDLPFGQHRWV